MAHVCSHVRAAVRAASPLPQHTRIEVAFDEDPSHVLRLHFCTACVRERELPERVSAEQWEVESARFETEPVCGRCFREATQRSAP